MGYAIMDTIIDKLAQKKNAQEMIRANSAAEAAKMEQMEKQLVAYDELMQEMRRVNIKTSENVENMRKLLAECMEKLESLESLETDNDKSADVEQQLAGIKSLLEERFAQSEEFMHKENVKVYRNVQAAFTEELGKQAQTSKGSGVPVGLCVAILIGVAADILINLIPMILGLMNVKLF